ncbi:T9SS type A sorting domain-containing protein [Psychroserpens ponticola]|uniref:T9SS type A sorting domain-containing protein n=1 Tax=Psychroserpens ponticola TaxID=2932268 RepID=A0ABY7S2N8_9FLAO|nr:PKD domain-containing protein [Psychroserpens ponticola]WCO03171.1 T9SS type A sorting domain-containing protein [Psychroserpens ponticola]
MKKTILLLLIYFSYQNSYCQWENLDSGINDNLSGIVFFEDTGIVSAENGLYYTLNGGNGSSNWQRFEITDNTQNATLYNNTAFNKCFSNPDNTDNTFKIFAVGRNTTTNKAVILSVEFPSLNYDIVTINVSNSGLNDIAYSSTFDRYFAVGDNGIFVSIPDNISNYSVLNTSFTEDLKAISFNNSGLSAKIGSVEKHHKVSINSATSQISTTYETPNETYTDILYSSTSSAYGVNDRYLRLYLASVVEYPNYNYGTLNGNTIFSRDNRNFIGTDHGIFMSNTSKDILEYQPSSLNYNITEFWNVNLDDSTLYACGSNGVILRNLDPTNEAEPFAFITSAEGQCVSTLATEIEAEIGSSTSCNWYINNVVQSSNCESFNYIFDTVGIYEIKLQVENNGLFTEHTRSIHVVNPPQIDKPISIIDAILCHEEPLEIQLENSEPDVKYLLYKQGSNEIFGASVEGNGATITFNTAPLNETGTYYLKSQNVFATNCDNSFTNTFDIIVEQTEAKFHTGLINAATNEVIDFFEQCTEASYYNWDFENATTVSSTLANPTNVFNSNGTYDVTLTANSENFCEDQITLSSPYIYNEPSDDQTCWSYLNESKNPSWTGFGNKDISNLTKVSDGYLTGGFYRNEVFGTNHGVSLNLENNQGGFLSKHNFKGVLKWLVYFTGSPLNGNSSGTNSMNASVEDQLGNIYIGFDINTNSGKFYDNTGNSVDLSSGGYIIKLNSKGEFIWSMRIRTFYPTGLTVDNNNDLIITGTYDLSNDNNHFVYLDDVQTDEVGTIIFPNNSNRYCNGIIKSDPNGNILWDNEIFSTSGTFGTPYHAERIGVDSNNNYYVQGQYKNEMFIYHTGSSVSTDLDYHVYEPGGSYYSHLFKLNSSGALSWVTRSYSTNSGEYNNVQMNDAITDDNGNTYITGTNRYFNTNYNHIHTVENADGTLFTNSSLAKSYYLKKIGADGFCDWIIGSDSENSDVNTVGYKLDLLNDRINVMCASKTTTDGSESIIFNDINNNTTSISIENTSVFIGNYTTEGLLAKVNVFNNVDLGNIISFQGFFCNPLNNYYVGTYSGDSSSSTDGLMLFFNDTCATIYDNNLSVDDYNITAGDLLLFPNPNNGDFTLRINKNYAQVKIKVYNLLGQVIVNNQHNNKKDIPIQIEGETGVYIAEIIIDNTYKRNIKILKY